MKCYRLLKAYEKPSARQGQYGGMEEEEEEEEEDGGSVCLSVSPPLHTHTSSSPQTQVFLYHWSLNYHWTYRDTGSLTAVALKA